MVSMKDIAFRCNVSVATVSKALSDANDVSEEKKAYIKKVADEMGYLANAAAKALKTKRTYNLGVLFVDNQHSGLSHEYFSSILESFKVEAEKRGYTITFINNYVGTRQTTYLQHCHYRGMDGVLIACVNFEDPEVIELVNSSIPVVTIDYTFNSSTSIMANNVQGISKLVEYVCSKNHKQIAFIHGEPTLVTKNRVAGFYKTCEEHGIEVPDEYLREGRYHDPDRCEEETLKILSLPNRPTCIFFPDDFSAIGGIRAITKAGLRIPEDISVVGYDGINLASVMNPPLTTLKQDSTEIGKLSAESLILAIENPRTTFPTQVTVDGSLEEGQSVKTIE